jgi:glycosyltransferase involved in cell wall biosynthesis
MSKKILFLLGSANMSGGTYVIFQHAMYLESVGYDVSIALVFMTYDELITLRDSPKCWHDGIRELNFIHVANVDKYQFDLCIFSWWATLFYIDKVKSTNLVYFVQSIESRFYGPDETFMQDLVQRTYQLGLPVITEASWIQEYLQSRFNNPCSLVKNGILKSVYSPHGEVFAARPTHGIRILVEGPLSVVYKNVEKTIELCRRANCGEIWLLTSSKIEHYQGVDRVFSQIPVRDVPKIYRSCDVIVKLSYVEGMFGPPLEMFHCGGTAIVYDVSGHDEYIIHNENSFVAKMDDEESVVRYLQSLSQDTELLQKLKDGAARTADKWIDWDDSSSQFKDALDRYCSQPVTEVGRLKINNNVIRLLREHIPVAVNRNNQWVNYTLTALPLYESGSYVMQIPLDPQIVGFKVIFGALYRRIIFQSFKLFKIDRNTEELLEQDPSQSVSFNGENMQSNDGNRSFNCLLESALLAVEIKKQNDFHHEEFKYLLQLEIRPLQIRSS